MVTQYDESESQRRQLGPLMPAGRVTLESFCSLADTFMQGCIALIEETSLYWQQKEAEQIQEHARKLEAYLIKEQLVRQDIEELKLKAEQMEATAKRAIEETEEIKQDKEKAILEADKKMKLLQAQLDIFMSIDTAIINRQHLKILEL